MQKKPHSADEGPKKTSWGKVAKWYGDLLEEKDDTYQKQVILPNLLRILSLKKGDTLIDIACGQGFFAGEYAKTGAEVTGADIAAELVADAKKKYPKIAFHVAASDSLSFAEPHTFDVATITLSIQNIERMSETFAEAKRVLKQGGRLVLVLNHPAFRVLKRSSWGYDETTKTQYRRLDGYLSGSTVTIDMHPGQKDSEKTISYHRSLQEIVKSLAKQGFAITRLEEWISHKESEEGPRKRAEDTARKEFPLFLMLETKVL